MNRTLDKLDSLVTSPSLSSTPHWARVIGLPQVKILWNVIQKDIVILFSFFPFLRKSASTHHSCNRPVRSYRRVPWGYSKWRASLVGPASAVLSRSKTMKEQKIQFTSKAHKSSLLLTNMGGWEQTGFWNSRISPHPTPRYECMRIFRPKNTRVWPRTLCETTTCTHTPTA